MTYIQFGRNITLQTIIFVLLTLFLRGPQKHKNLTGEKTSINPTVPEYNSKFGITQLEK